MALSPSPASSLTRFNHLWRLICRRQRLEATPLEPLLQRVFDEFNRSPTSSEAVRVSLVELFQFLSSPDGYDRRNLDVVTDFVLAENEWEMDWSYLPSQLEDVMFELSSGTPMDEARAKHWPNQLLYKVQNCGC